jgi:hypothetical protein
MWTGAVIPASADATSPAHLVTTDVSCTNPAIPAGGVDFRNFAYSGSNADPLAATLDRTREGYAEIFEMAVITHGSAPANAATHGSSGKPTCTGLVGPTITFATGVLAPPTGGLSGTGTIINVLSGRDTMYNARAFGAYSATPIYSDIGNDLPNFASTNPAASITIDPDVGLFVASWTSSTNSFFTVSGGAKAASATMMHTDVINEYILDAATNSDTDWVLTFPTKRLFVSADTAITPFTAPLTSSGACELVALTYFNREEATAQPGGVDFSPTPPGAAANTLCWESTVLSLRNGSGNAPNTPAVPSEVLGSANVTAVALNSTFQNGWIDLTFVGTNATTTGLAADATSITVVPPFTAAGAPGAFTYLGLPVVGFMVRTFTNGALSCSGGTCQGNYLGSADHAFITNP